MKKIFYLFAAMVCSMSMIAETFTKVTDAATLQDGDKVVMAYQSDAAKKVSGGFSSTSKFLNATDATFADNHVTLDNPTVITLKKSGNNWKLYIGSNPIGHSSGSKDLNKTTQTEYAISFTDGKVHIVSQTTTTYAFYYNTSSPRFALYAATSNQQPIELYKLDESSIPETVVTSVSLNKKSMDLRMGNTETLTATVQPTDAADKTIAWGTTDASVATVANGVVTPVAVGTAKIWVKATAVENVSDTCVVTVLPAEEAGTATYNAVQSADYLTAGAKVFFGTIKDNENYVMGQYVSGNNIKGVAATYGDGRHSVTAPLQVAYTVQREGDYYVFVDHDGKYLRTIASNKLGNGTELDDYAKWTLGSFDEDDATVVLTNKANSTKGIYNNFQGTNDMFNIYAGVGDGSYLAKTVLYSNVAPAWVERVRDPWMKADTTYLDWGTQEPDEYSHDWGDTRYLHLTMNDLPGAITVALTDDANGAFNCWTGTISASKTSENLLIEWSATQVGVYNGTLTLTCEGLQTIVVNLHAEAVAQGQGGGGEATVPTLTVSHNAIYLNPNYMNNMDDEITFTFTAAHLAKTLYVKWERDNTAPWFPYSSEYMEMWRVADNDYVQMYENDKVSLGTDDITDGEIYMHVYAYNAGNYASQLHFTSLKADSKTELAIDKVIPITIVVSENPTPNPTVGIDETDVEIKAQKIFRDGQVVIIRNGQSYSVDGKQL